ncbi:Hint domain-containing protein [Psychromarinibacter sp. S121]|uniref:Hint domain-containing protein n=1 Tax=Psychromarinibacter sp. S121 TaxID=3415127 RepID=UPI003C7CF3DA
MTFDDVHMPLAACDDCDTDRAVRAPADPARRAGNDSMSETPCFTPGTMIATTRGAVAVEDLQLGDRVMTRDNGFQEIRWIGSRALGPEDMAAKPHLQPVLIRKGALGNDLPSRDMYLSPNHRVLVASEMTALYFEEREVLCAAKHLINNRGVHQARQDRVTYIHFMFDRHEVVLSDGAWSESFQPGDTALRGIGTAQRQEIFQLFPELRAASGQAGFLAARRVLTPTEARRLHS